MRSNHKTASRNPAPAVTKRVIWASIPVLLVDLSACRVKQRAIGPCSCARTSNTTSTIGVVAASRLFRAGCRPVIGSQPFEFSARRQPRSACPSMSRARCASQFGHSVRSTAIWSPDSILPVVTDTCWPHRGQGDSLIALDKAQFLQLVDRDLASDRVRLPLRHIPLQIRLACRRLVRAINCPLKRLSECCRLA